MKRVILVIFLATVYIETFSQFQKNEIEKDTVIGQIKDFGNLRWELSLKARDGDSSYCLTYNDLSYKTINSYETVCFNGGIETLASIKSVLLSACDLEKGSEQEFTLGTTQIKIKSNRLLGVRYLDLFITKPSGYIGSANINKKEIIKLFGE